MNMNHLTKTFLKWRIVLTSLFVCSFLPVIADTVHMYVYVNNGIYCEVNSGAADYQWSLVEGSEYVSPLNGGGSGCNYYQRTAWIPTPDGVYVVIRCTTYTYEAGHKVADEEIWFYIRILDPNVPQPGKVFIDTIATYPPNGSTGLPINVTFKVKLADLVEINPNSPAWPTIGAGFPMFTSLNYDESNKTTTVTLTPLNWVSERMYLKENTYYPIYLPREYFRKIDTKDVMENDIYLSYTTGTGISDEYSDDNQNTGPVTDPQSGLRFICNGSNAIVINPEGNKYSGDIVIPETINVGTRSYSVTSIDEGAFKGCENVTSVTSSSVVSINKEAFRGCTNLTKVNIPQAILDGEAIFYDCKNLTTVNLANDGLLLYQQTFYNCEKLANYDLPSSVVLIYFEAFYGCKSLRKIDISNVNWIFYDAFRGSGLTEVTIPKSVTISGDPFSYCDDLETIYVEDGTDLSSEGFRGLSNLKHFYCYGITPPPLSSMNPFFNTDISKATLHVPYSAIDTYKSTAPWSGFGSIVDIETGIREAFTTPASDVVYDLHGKRLDKMNKGLNIIRKPDGKMKKVISK